jgi:inner membrane protein
MEDERDSEDDAMDPVTHLATGGLGGRALKERFPGRAVVLLTITAALIPDVDNFVGIGNPELYMIHHRGITHSFLGGLGIALLLAALFRVFSRSLSFRHGLLIGYAFIVSHIFLDLITSYGTQIFTPLTDNRYTVQCVFIIDPVFTLTLVGLWIFAARSRTGGRTVAIAGLLWVAAYPGINLAIRWELEQHVAVRLAAQGVTYDSLELSPEALTPFFWKLVLEDGASYRLASVSLFEPNRTLALEDFRKADRALMGDLGRKVSLFMTFSWFAAYPVMETTETPEGSRVTFGDLRFHSTLPRMRAAAGRERSPFSLTALLDREGKLVAYEYGGAEGTRLMRVE